jgi:hypothetical protein
MLLRPQFISLIDFLPETNLWENSTGNRFSPIDSVLYGFFLLPVEFLSVFSIDELWPKVMRIISTYKRLDKCLKLSFYLPIFCSDSIPISFYRCFQKYFSL